MHNGFIQVNAEKMSKSLGNFETIRDLLENFTADAIRVLMLQTHYRSPIDFSLDSLQAAKMGSQRLARALALETVGANGNGASSDFVQGVEKDSPMP